ncbi:penicillin-binding protein 1A [Granulosicoccaceae sp. 1_MG-2023]|nr:penicillin-binding protein 1A [Granulosicoccaceae sp. 1_MG-2023]
MASAKPLWRRLLKWFFVLGVAGVLVAAVAVVAVYYKFAPNLPSIESLNHVQFQVPLRVYTRDAKLIAEFGEKRREPVHIDGVPPVLKQAFLAAEDDRFYEHPGVDYHGILRAAINLIRTGERGQGGSTITMQVARNFFLSNRKTYERKLNEILLSFQIESELSKDKILELYLNKIYLGNRAYGVGAASRVYYGKDVMDLTLAEAAMIAGLPKAPSRYNPIVNPERALIRRDYVLRRMHELGYISDQAFQEALAMPVTARLHVARPDVEAGYVAEMVRSRLLSLYGERIYTSGLKVYTTLDSAQQMAATAALRKGLVDYEKRHGFTGPVGNIDIQATLAEARLAQQEQSGMVIRDAEDADTDTDTGEDTEVTEPALIEALDGFAEYGHLKAALVLAVSAQEAQLLVSDGVRRTLALADAQWARERLGKDRLGPEVTALDQVLSSGDVVYVEVTGEQSASLAQLPQVEGALVAIQPQSGALLSLVGGFDFYKSKFNRVIQAHRQPGSNFKPFIYSAALERGDSVATIYNDAPVVFHDSALEGEWRPENYSGRFFGPTRLREALVKSRNLVSIRVLRSLGLRRALDYVSRFGFNRDELPYDLSLALGSGAVTPLQLVSGYAVFANGGYLVSPFFIDEIQDTYGETLFRAPQVELCDEECDDSAPDMQVALSLGAADESKEAGLIEAAAGDAPADAESAEEAGVDDGFAAIEPAVYKAPRVIGRRNAYLMGDVLREVVRRGTATRAKVLKRSDLAGKTGTTNDQNDAWFSGFNSQVAASVWVGFDELQPLGARETGGRAALPIWVDYMREALRDVPEDQFVHPDGIVSVRIDRLTGQRTSAGNPNSMFELFRDDNAPQENQQVAPVEVYESGSAPLNAGSPAPSAPVEQLF